MTALTNPLDVARETLKRLAAERTPPTPDNYRNIYHQIAGTSGRETRSPPEHVIIDLLAALSRTSDDGRRLATQGEQCLREADWTGLSRALTKALPANGDQPSWNNLLSTLIAQLDRPQQGLTPSSKRAALERMLASTRSPPLLASRLEELLREWSSRGNSEPANATPPPPEPNRLTDRTSTSWQEACAFVLEMPCASSLRDIPALELEARELAGRMRAAQSPPAANDVLSQLRKFAFRVELASEDRGETSAGVLNLLQLMIDNIGELLIDDRWIHGQTNVLREILSNPLNARAIDSAERRLRDLVFKQSQMKAGLIEAQQSLKTMLKDFVGHLAAFARDTGAYHAKIDSYAEQIIGAGNIADLHDVIQEVAKETRNIHVRALQTQEDLLSAQSRVEAAERRVAELEAALAKTSDMVHHDFLTGALNRRGLEEVFGREISRSMRHQTPLCAAVLDVDNFKQLNDSLGHQAGDEALTHLYRVIRESTRPQDTVARYGGEEFVILLPDTELNEAQQTLTRVQRELTRRFFLHENQRILITFSAGVTQIPHGESGEDAIARADALMYKAKQSGKNKVVSDELLTK